MSKLVLPIPELNRLETGSYSIEEAPMKNGTVYSGVRGAMYGKALLQLDVGDERMILRRLGRKNRQPKPIQFRVLRHREDEGKDPKFLKVLHEPVDQIDWALNESGLWVADSIELGIKRPELFVEVIGKVAAAACWQQI